MFPQNTRILIADDMPTIRELVKTQLRSMGYKNVLEASDGEEAFAFLLKASVTPDPVGLVISDWNMPKRTGFEFLKQVRTSERFADLPFVLLTSEAERDLVTEAIMAGVNQYIVKPFTPKAFEEKLKGVWLKLQKAA